VTTNSVRTRIVNGFMPSSFFLYICVGIKDNVLLQGAIWYITKGYVDEAASDIKDVRVALRVLLKTI
jgi:hypothetical protein